jgi:membrane fusion protein (multidrug efflux system)
VAVVGAENKAAIKQVKVGNQFGQSFVIEEGLAPGEKVVAEGIQKVQDGMVVNPKPFAGETKAEPGAQTGAAQKPEAKPEAKPQPKTKGR